MSDKSNILKEAALKELSAMFNEIVKRHGLTGRDAATVVLVHSTDVIAMQWSKRYTTRKQFRRKAVLAFDLLIDQRTSLITIDKPE